MPVALGRAQGPLPVLPQSSPGPLIRHPCYHSGYWATLSPATLYESPCVHTTPPPGLAWNLTVEGTGNPGACVSAIRGLFNFSSCEGRGHCAFNGVYQPPVRGQFYVSGSPLHCPPRAPSPLLEPQRPDARQAQGEPWMGGDSGSPGVCVGGGGAETLLGWCWGSSDPSRPRCRPGAGTPSFLPRPQAFSNFYYTFHFLNVTSKQPLATVNATVWEFCQRPWKQVSGSWDHPSPPALPSTLGCRCPRHRPPQAGPRQDHTPGVWPAGLGDAQGREDPGRGPRGPSLGGTCLWWAGRGGVTSLLAYRAPR